MNQQFKKYLSIYKIYGAFSIFILICGGVFSYGLGSCMGCPEVIEHAQSHVRFIVRIPTVKVQTHYPCYGCPVLAEYELSADAEYPSLDVSQTQETYTPESASDVIENNVTTPEDVCERVQHIGVTLLDEDLVCPILIIPQGSTVITNGFIVRTKKLILDGVIMHNGLSGLHGAYFGKGAGLSGNLHGKDGEGRSENAFEYPRIPDTTSCLTVGGGKNVEEYTTLADVMSESKVSITAALVENIINETVSPCVVGGIGGDEGFLGYSDMVTPGAGGGGGGVIVIQAGMIEGTGLIQARGGSGGDIKSTSFSVFDAGDYAGVGKGGGGGAIIIVFDTSNKSFDSRILTDVSAGPSGIRGQDHTLNNEGQIWQGSLATS